MASTNPTHRSVHALQFYDTEKSQIVTIAAGTDFIPTKDMGKIDDLVKSGAVKKIDRKVEAAEAESDADKGKAAGSDASKTGGSNIVK
jgi:hypothetical protein